MLVLLILEKNYSCYTDITHLIKPRVYCDIWGISPGPPGRGSRAALPIRSRQLNMSIDRLLPQNQFSAYVFRCSGIFSMLTATTSAYVFRCTCNNLIRVITQSCVFPQPPDLNFETDAQLLEFKSGYRSLIGGTCPNCIDADDRPTGRH